MTLDELLKPEHVAEKKKYSEKEFASFLDSQSFEHRQNQPDLIRHHSILYLSGYYAAKDQLIRNTIHLSEDLKRMYYAAASTKHLLNTIQGDDYGLNFNLSSLNFNTSDYESNLRVLKKYNEELKKREEDINNLTVSFFSMLNKSINNYLIGAISDKELEKIRHNPPKEKRRKEKTTNAENINLENISFIETKYNDIIGNKDAKDALTNSMKKLFLYNKEKQKNPAQEKMQFKQNFLLTGEPGNGKGMLAAYAATIGTNLSKKLNKELKIISMESNSSYQDGPILKLLNYLNTISNSNDLYLVILDEIDSMFTSRTNQKTQNYQKKLVTELLKFTSNSVEYINKGNYVLTAMTNNTQELDPAFLNRMNKGTYHCEGPKTQEEKSKLIQTLIHKMVPKEKIKIQNWREIGRTAYDLKLSGRELKDCTENLLEANTNKEMNDEIYKLSYEEQLKHFENFNEITEQKIIEQLQDTGNKRKTENYLLNGGYHVSN